jgi:DNA polymerase
MNDDLLETLREFFDTAPNVEEAEQAPNFTSGCEISELSETILETRSFPSDPTPINGGGACEIISQPDSTSAGEGIVSIDFETVNRSGCQLVSKPKRPGVGTYRYLADPKTEPLVLSYEHGGDAALWYPEQGAVDSLISFAADPDARFLSHNTFDLILWNTLMVALGYAPIPAERWIDTMAICAYNALPLELDGALKVLGLPIEKDKKGKALTLSLSRPNRKGIYPEITPEIQTRVGTYCHVDRGGAAAIYRMVGVLPERERAVWLFDHAINARGFRPDLDFTHAAKAIVENQKERLVKEFRDITGANPSQIAAAREWLAGQGCDPGGLAKDVVTKALKAANLPDNVRRALELRLETAPVSVAKLDAILACVGNDGRIRGALQYHGAETGRWAGRLLNPHNMPRQEADSPPADELVAAVMTRDPDALRQWGDPIEVISKSMRAVIVAEPGSRLAIGDFSTIELRLLLHHADDKEKIARFRTGNYDPYREFAALLFQPKDPAAYLATPKAELSPQQKGERQTAATSGSRHSSRISESLRVARMPSTSQF